MDAKLSALLRSYAMGPTDELAHQIANYMLRMGKHGEKNSIVNIIRDGQPKNVTIVGMGELEFLYSYDTRVAYLDRRLAAYFVTTMKHSRTTSRHIGWWIAGLERPEGGLIRRPIKQEELDRVAL